MQLVFSTINNTNYVAKRIVRCNASEPRSAYLLSSRNVVCYKYSEISQPFPPFFLMYNENRAPDHNLCVVFGSMNITCELRVYEHGVRMRNCVWK
jgi:hypothetical protein